MSCSRLILSAVGNGQLSFEDVYKVDDSTDKEKSKRARIDDGERISLGHKAMNNENAQGQREECKIGLFVVALGEILQTKLYVRADLPLFCLRISLKKVTFVSRQK